MTVVGQIRRRCARGARQARTLMWLALKLAYLSALGSPLWILMVVKLVLFALALSPALVASMWYWLRHVRKNLAYGPGLRHLVDVYEPAGGGSGRPIIIFVTGGAWVIGYKAWAVPLGRALSSQGVVVVAPDYRNCPQARIDGMLEDVDRAVGWVFDNAHALGGDRQKIVIAGQSAGAHLCALLLLRKAENEQVGRNNASLPRWRPSDVVGFVGVSGPYHLEATAVHWIARGFNKAIFRWVFSEDVAKHSPTDECSRLLDEHNQHAHSNTTFGSYLPRFCLIHGTADQSAPSVASELLEARLRLLGARVEPTRKYRDWTHTDPILERPFAGDHTLHSDMYNLLINWLKRDQDDTRGLKAAFDDQCSDCRRLAPQILLDLGRLCMPF